MLLPAGGNVPSGQVVLGKMQHCRDVDPCDEIFLTAEAGAEISASSRPAIDQAISEDGKDEFLALELDQRKGVCPGIRHAIIARLKLDLSKWSEMPARGGKSAKLR